MKLTKKETGISGGCSPQSRKSGLGETVDRRTFIKRSGVAAGGIAAASLPMAL
ncbi:MAG: twin-arginine translocation signal domain-containing protein, partial [Gammaproteobacteria bacterium]|nr:twin-arginine translocation signal domain-containing protein [Gammaproteobacteria bacterium]